MGRPGPGPDWLSPGSAVLWGLPTPAPGISPAISLPLLPEKKTNIFVYIYLHLPYISNYLEPSNGLVSFPVFTLSWGKADTCNIYKVIIVSFTEK